eukprot:TRINITY_DN13050_c0_g1_i1.p1 TRINITY_DN13050_c0_g1~~TRINITY_DN13050_c0_g1_i1.p1  ORF type:complete len:378 (+),score=70.69 TRINITY_DN13050_c0_g1_i1:42-1136(+)
MYCLRVPSIKSVLSSARAPLNRQQQPRTRAININVACSPEGEEGQQKRAGKPGKKERTEFQKYWELCKPSLGRTVLFTTGLGYFLAPGVMDWGQLGLTLVGTAMTIGSAHTLNQWAEVEYDAMMNRTRDRVLPKGEMSKQKAFAFGAGAGILGTVLLATTVNPMAAALAGGNVLLYVWVYTPMKRMHWLNTWVGSVVGAIPPLIGWAAACGGDLSDYRAWVLAWILFNWQIPHFLALSWSHKEDYARAQYKMLVQENQELATRLSLLHSVLLFLVPALSAAEHSIPSYAFAMASASSTMYFTYTVLRFLEMKDHKTARKVFFTSLWYLPLLLTIMAAEKYFTWRKEKKELEELKENENIEAATE